jgi:hypothetical protein
MGGVTDGLKYDNTGTLRAVNVNWNDDGWNVNANSVENPNDWNDGNQVFSRNYCFSPRPMVGEFLLVDLFSSRQAAARFLPIPVIDRNIFPWVSVYSPMRFERKTLQYQILL